MKILTGYAIILGCLISYCACYNLTVTVDFYHKAIYRFVKQVVKDWNQKHENDISDISIINFDNDTSLFEIVMKAIPKDNPIMLPECKTLGTDEYTHKKKSSIFIIVSKILSDARQYLNRLYGCIDSDFLETTSNVIVIPSRKVLSSNDVYQPSAVFSTTKVLNFVIPYIEEQRLDIYTGDVLGGNLKLLNYTHDTDVLFSDKLADMKNYTYRALGDKNDKRLVYKGDKIYLPEIQLMETIAKKQNAQLATNLTEIREIKDFGDEIREGKVDMVLNLGYYSGLLGGYSQVSSVNTYEVNGYCILTPISKDRHPFLKYITKPFSNNVWCILVLLVIAGALIWQGYRKLSKNRLISWKYFVTSVVLSFYQQSTRVRKSRLMLRIMLQIFIFMMIVLANVYQGTMTSTLMNPQKHKMFSNIEELLKQDYQFHSDALFYQLMMRYDTERNIIKKIKPHEIWLQNADYIKQFQKLMTKTPNNALIVGCEAVPELLETQIDHKTKASDVYYKFQHEMLTYYEKIILTRRSPFHKKLSEMSLRIHESGIKQHWAMLMEEYRNLRHDHDNVSLLKMKEIFPIIHIYIYGVTLACLVFILELSRSYIRLIYRKFIKKCARRIQKYRNRKVGPRLQRIQKNETTRVEEGMPLYPYLN